MSGGSRGMLMSLVALCCTVRRPHQSVVVRDGVAVDMRWRMRGGQRRRQMSRRKYTGCRLSDRWARARSILGYRVQVQVHGILGRGGLSTLCVVIAWRELGLLLKKGFNPLKESKGKNDALGYCSSTSPPSPASPAVAVPQTAPCPLSALPGPS